MSDRELLELAAKASGLPYCDHYDEANPALLVPTEIDGEAEEWNPLVSDADALRLAVKLKLDVKQMHDRNCVEAGCYRKIAWQSEKRAADPYAATRLAIVRAAAEIGRSM